MTRGFIWRALGCKAKTLVNIMLEDEEEREIYDTLPQRGSV